MSHTIFLVEDDPALRGELAALLEAAEGAMQ